MRRGDVVIVDYPFSDRTGSKVRPALIVQSDVYNQRLADTIIALITSSAQRFVGSPTQLIVDIATADGKQTGLRINSVVQCENLITLDQSLILRVIGRFPANLLQKINPCLRAALDIP
jgi:mRNA interferase MazF